MHAAAYQTRLAKLQKILSSSQSSTLLADPQHIRYLTGFESLAPGEREAFLLLNGTRAILFHASFSPVENHDFITYVPKCSIAAVVEQHTADEPLAIDAQAVTALEYQEVLKANVQLSNFDTQKIWELRMHKDIEELKIIATATQITKQVLEETLAILQPDTTELDICRRLEAKLLLAGADGTAFPTIVAFGPHSALPHHQPTEKKLENNMAVLIDCGAKVAGYCGDMTRTIWFGDTPDPEFVKIKRIVKEAFAAAQAVLQQEQPTAAQIDAAARKIIVDAGYGKQFIHTTGHGVGLSIHEPPSLSAKTETVIDNGVVITIEPGIYLAGKFGIRWEDTISTIPKN